MNAYTPFARPAAAAGALAALALSLASCAPRTAPTGAASRAAPSRIASMAPAYTDILLGLGLGGSIVAADAWSAPGGELPADLPRFDMMKPDAERLAALAPDLVLVSEMTKQGTSVDPFKPLSDSGIAVEYIPTSANVAEIRDAVTRIAALAGKEAGGKKLVADMDRAIEEVRRVADSIPGEKRRTVVFEISPAPYIYSFGRGVYLDELLSALGAKNALADSEGWISVSAETIVAADPDVILTNVNYGVDPVAEIKARPGWEGMKAVREGRVFYIDGDSSSQPSPSVVKALREMARAVYPEYFE